MNNLNNQEKKLTVNIIGMAIKEGQPEEGVEKGPEYFRKAKLQKHIESLGHQVVDSGNIDEEQIAIFDKFTSSNQHNSQEQYKYNIKNSEIIGKACELLYNRTLDAFDNNHFPLILGGDHSVATGSIHAAAQKYNDLRVIWVDAHGDINTPETSPSGNYHGMPAAHVSGLMGYRTVKGFDWLKPVLNPKNLVFIGLRDLDSGEKKILKDNQIKCYTIDDIEDAGGIGNVMKEIFEYLDVKNHPLHLSFDIDGIDPMYAPGTGTKSQGGLTFREANYICRKCFGSGKLVSMDMVEINPDMDVERKMEHGDLPGTEGIKQTMYVGIELILSALGRKLL